MGIIFIIFPRSPITSTDEIRINEVTLIHTVLYEVSVGVIRGQRSFEVICLNLQKNRKKSIFGSVFSEMFCLGSYFKSVIFHQSDDDVMQHGENESFPNQKPMTSSAFWFGMIPNEQSENEFVLFCIQIKKQRSRDSFFRRSRDLENEIWDSVSEDVYVEYPY